MKHERWERLQRESEALQAWARKPIKTEQEQLKEAWDELQAVPSYVEQQAQAWAAELNLEVA